jgi:hypothetical protein
MSAVYPALERSGSRSVESACWQRSHKPAVAGSVDTDGT